MKTRIIFSFLSTLLFILACSTEAFPGPDPTAMPNFQPTQVEFISQTVILRSVTFNEEGQTPPYKITALTPNLTGSDDPRVEAFNTQMHDLVMGEIDDFKNNTLQIANTPPISAGSFLDIQYSLIGQKGDFWSIKFDNTGYADGAAHPYHYSITVNYDLEQGKEITLDEIFLPNSNYLKKISDICKAELSSRDIGFDMDIFSQGADPAPENYQHWNISNEGLVITFDEYQVAPYAAGPQIVTIPFRKLAGLIDPQSPLATFLS